MEDLQAALEDLVVEGKIGAYGWNTDFPDRAERWLGGANFKALQAEINVLNHNDLILAIAESNGLACLNRGPPAMGLLSGKYNANSTIGVDDVRGRTPDWLSYFNDGVPAPEFLAKLDEVREILTSNGRSLVQGAIAWLWGRSLAAIPIPGIRTVDQARENAAAMLHGPLTPDQIKEVASLLRYGESRAIYLK